MKIIRCLRPLLFAILLVLSFTTLSEPKFAQAQITRTGHEIDFYSDATFTHLVGFIAFCRNGQTIREGQTTQFSKVVASGC